MKYELNGNEEIVKKEKVRMFVDEIDISYFLSNKLIDFLSNNYELDVEEYGNDKREHRVRIKVYDVNYYK